MADVLAAPGLCVRPPAEPVPAALAGSPAGDVFGRLVRMTDGTYHAAMKAAVVASLAPIDRWRVAEAAGSAVRALAIGDPGRPLPDRIADAMARLPVATVALLLGVRAGDLAGAVERTGAFVRAIGPGPSPRQVADGAAAAADLARLLGAATDGPVADLLARARAAGLDAPAALANALGFLSQTWDATAGLVGNALLAAAAHAEARARILADPARTGDFLCEVLRHDPPVHNSRRFAADDTTVAGVPVPAGAAILVLLAAANRDPLANPDPHRFDPDRRDRRLFSLGAGRHACPGETIALGIATAALHCLAGEAAGIAALAGRVAYRPLPNARVPVLR